MYMNNYVNYTELANTIIKQASEDYRYKEDMRPEIERFFLSDWYKLLTDFPGKKLLNILKKELNMKI